MPSLRRLLSRFLRRWEHTVTEDDIYYCYRLFLRRPPDPAGFAHHQREMERGMTLDELASSFINSEEARGLAGSGPTAVDLGGYQVCMHEQMETEPFLRGILNTREYEPHVRQAIRERVREGDVVVDVGANIGCIALLAATLVGKQGLVIAVEPNLDNVQLLYAGMALNHADNMKVLPYAASDRPGLVSLTGGSNAHLIDAQQPGATAVYAQAVALDEELSWVPRLDLLKMDVEGHEPLALDGCRELIERHRPTLIVEFSPTYIVNHGQTDPAGLLDRILGSYPAIRATSAYGDDATFERSVDLMAYWERRSRELTTSGTVAGDALHFDLIAEPGRGALGRRHRAGDAVHVMRDLQGRLNVGRKLTREETHER